MLPPRSPGLIAHLMAAKAATTRRLTSSTMQARLTSTAAVCLLILTGLSLHVGGHPAPPNLAALDCAVGALAAEFAAARFPNDADGVTVAVQRAMNVQLCNSTINQREGTMPPRQFTRGSRKSTDKESPPGGYPTHSPDTPRPGEMQLYVAINGSDINGTGGIEAPFATPHRARDEIRKIPVQQRPPITVYLREGTYYLSVPLALGSEDSGSSANNSIVYTALGAEKVTLSAGVALPSDLPWDPYNAPVVGAAFVSTIPEGPPRKPSLLFMDNVRAIRSRFPNGNPADNSGLCYEVPRFADEGCRGHVLSGSSTGKRQWPKAYSMKANPAVTRYGDYPSFDFMVGGFASLYTGPGEMCVPASSVSEPVVICNNTNTCLVNCTTNGSLPWFTHYGRITDMSTGFAYDPATWTTHHWANVKNATVRAISPIGWGSATYVSLIVSAAASGFACSSAKPRCVPRLPNGTPSVC